MPGKTTPALSTRLELRQHMLEDGTFIDFPAAILRHPPPNPIEFIYLKHHFEDASGVAKSLKQSSSAEVAIDILADEVESMRHLLHGYVHNIQRYVDKFDAEQARIREEFDSIRETYKGTTRGIYAAFKASLQFERMFKELEEKVRNLQPMTRPPPIIIKDTNRGAAKEPEMTKEQQKENDERAEGHYMRAEELSRLTTRLKRADEYQLLADLLNPPPVMSDAAKPALDKAKFRGAVNKLKTDINPRVSLKVEKLAGSLEAMRTALQRTQTMTEEELIHMRVASACNTQNIEEVWDYHDHFHRMVHSMGKTSNRHIRRAEAYDRWATKCQEDAAALVAGTSTANAPGPTGEPAAQPSTSNPTAIPLGTDPMNAPRLANDVYAVCLDLKCEKDFDELSREEAVELLKTLPLRVHFIPYGSVDDSEPCRSESDEDEVEEILSAVRRPTVDDAPVDKEAEPSVDVAPAALAIEGTSMETKTRKRTRRSEEESNTVDEERTAAREAPGVLRVRKRLRKN